MVNCFEGFGRGWGSSTVIHMTEIELWSDNAIAITGGMADVSRKAQSRNSDSSS